MSDILAFASSSASHTRHAWHCQKRTHYADASNERLNNHMYTLTVPERL